MKVLVLGDSGSAGIANKGASMTTVFCDQLAAASEDPVSMEHATFIATGERAIDRAKGRVEEHRPDLVIMVVGPYLFTTKFVWIRVERLFGKRVGGWFRTSERQFNSRARRSGRVLQRVNATAKKLAGKVIGGDTITTREESADVVRGTLRMLASHEGQQVVVLAYPLRKGYLANDRQIADRWAYMADVRSAAEQHHFLFLDGTDADAPGTEFKAQMPGDDLHSGIESHTRMGNYFYGEYRKHAEAAPS
jgi:hypothetical protein